MIPFKKMKEAGLLEDYTVEGLFFELATIKKIKLANGETLVTELTMKHRTILEKMGLCVKFSGSQAARDSSRNLQDLL